MKKKAVVEIKKKKEQNSNSQKIISSRKKTEKIVDPVNLEPKQRGQNLKQPQKKTDKKTGKEDIKNWEVPGRPIRTRTWKPRSRRDDEKQVEAQQEEIEEYGYEVGESVYDEESTARKATGNTAPPILMDDKEEWAEDVKDSSVLPVEVYNAFYRTGGVLQTIKQAETLQEKYREIDRVGEVMTEEEIAAIRAQYRVPKGGMLNLPEWDPYLFPPDGTMVLFGRRRSGKSWFVRWIFHMYAHIYRLVIVLTNTKQNEFWSEHVPFRYIHKYDPFVVQRIIEEQESIIAQNKLNADHPELIQNPYIAVILDDVVSNDMHHDPLLNQLFYEGRHSNMAIFITTQHPKALPPGVRSNADAAIIYPQISENDEEAIRKAYCNFFDDKTDFSLALSQYTREHKCLVIFLGDNQAMPLQRLYWYKADDPGTFFCGAREYWEGDEEVRRAYYEDKAGFNKQASDVGSASGPAPAGWQWLATNTDASRMIQALTF